MATTTEGASPLELGGLTELTRLAVLTFVLSGAPMTLAQYYDLLPNDNLVILAPTLGVPLLIVGLYLTVRVETESTIGYGTRLWLVLAMTNVGLMGVLYAALAAAFGMP